MTCHKIFVVRNALKLESGNYLYPQLYLQLVDNRSIACSGMPIASSVRLLNLLLEDHF